MLIFIFAWFLFFYFFKSLSAQLHSTHQTPTWAERRGPNVHASASAGLIVGLPVGGEHPARRLFSSAKQQAAEGCGVMES